MISRSHTVPGLDLELRCTRHPVRMLYTILEGENAGEQVSLSDPMFLYSAGLPGKTVQGRFTLGTMLLVFKVVPA